MICPHCQAVHHICPECGGRGRWLKGVPNGTRYECDKGHRWTEESGEVVKPQKRGAEPSRLSLAVRDMPPGVERMFEYASASRIRKLAEYWHGNGSYRSRTSGATVWLEIKP